MGLLSKGTPLDWSEAKRYAEHVRQHGIEQLLNIYNRVKTRERDCLLWGDEIEYMLVKFNDQQKTARLSLRASDVLEQLQKEEHESPNPMSSWKPEYARYMLEGTPMRPYGSTLKGLLEVEPNMLKRREMVQRYLKEDEYLLCLTNFPRLGAGEFLDPHHEPRGNASHSLFIPDEAIAPHARFPTLTGNIRKRRGSKVAINVPIFHDLNTPKPFIENFPPAVWPEDGAQAALPDHIFMDCMCFGMGCSCLQMTFQASSITEARHIYDQLAVLTPIMLALTAATPVFRGFLADVDCRWDIISRSVDDRTPEERGQASLKNDRFRIYKSRYDSISTFISSHPNLKEKYNDLELVMDTSVYEKLRNNGFDHLLARHFSHLFIRDPLVIYAELINQDDSNSSDHFENIQSTNWQTMRFKPPPPNSEIGWRVEFRSMEIQMTEFENAAFAIFVVLLSRAILSFDLNLYVPMSLVDENMKTAQRRNAAREGKFHFRKHISGVIPSHGSPMPHQVDPFSLMHFGSPSTSSFLSPPGNQASPVTHEDPDVHCLMSINEIINGSAEHGFPGLISIVDSYLNSMSVDIETRFQLNRYLNLVRRRASGEWLTGASWIRQFITSHPAYSRDSRVRSEINYDLMKAIEKITRGEWRPTEMYGKDWKSEGNCC